MSSVEAATSVRRGWLMPVLLVAAVVALALRQEQVRVEPRYCDADVKPGGDTTVMLSTTWCGYCAEARRYLHAEGIRHCELDTERSARGAELYRALGGHGVPVVIARDGVMHGYDRAALQRLLADAPRAPAQ